MTTVRVIGGGGWKDADLIGKSDPVCVVSINGQSQQTREHKSGGTQAQWNQVLQFNTIGPITVEVRDSDFGKDDVMGRGQVDANRLVPGMANPVDVHLVNPKNGQQAGRVSLEVTTSGGGHPHGGGYGGGYHQQPYGGGYPTHQYAPTHQYPAYASGGYHPPYGGGYSSGTHYDHAARYRERELEGELDQIRYERDRAQDLASRFARVSEDALNAARTQREFSDVGIGSPSFVGGPAGFSSYNSGPTYSDYMSGPSYRGSNDPLDHLRGRHSELLGQLDTLRGRGYGGYGYGGPRGRMSSW